MGDYESQYERYKNTLLHETWFRRKLNEIYADELSAEKEYIERNGVLWKVGALLGVCGICLSLFWTLGGRSDARSIIARIIVSVVIIACFVFTIHIVTKFKKNSGETNFYAFRYRKYFEDRVQKDKDKETNGLMQELWESYDSLLWQTDEIHNMSREELEALFFRHLNKMHDYRKRYDNLSRYDGFSDDLKNDYYFNAEIQKDIDKYI